MELIQAVIATGVSKVVAKSQIAKLDDQAKAKLKKSLEGKMDLPKRFANDFRSAVVVAQKKARGKAIKRPRKK